jgi:ABC-2 type transport system ATP-binding protein
LITVQDFHKAYDRTVAVCGLNFCVEPGQILGLIGPNGAGKTTTLRALAGIIPASRGRLDVSGFEIQEAPLPAKRRLAYIPDDPQLFHDLTVAQHLTFAAAAYQVPQADAKIAALLREFQLDQKVDAPVSDLSRGMRQKLAVCAAYLHDPVAILFDEPLTGLDPHGIRALKTSICQRAESGAAIIISSHLLAMVEDICSHVLILAEGQQRFFGPLAAVHREFTTGTPSMAVTLEEIFFRATELIDAAQSPV